MFAIAEATSAVLSLAAIVVLLRICWTDFFYLKIWNRDLLVLLGIAAAFLLLTWPEDILLRLAFGMIVFTLSFGFWLFRSMGAGDVKLFGIVGCLIEPEFALPFVGLILVFAVVVFLFYQKARVLRFAPLLAGRRALELMDMGRIPYGVPISLAAISLIGSTFVGGT